MHPAPAFAHQGPGSRPLSAENSTLPSPTRLVPPTSRGRWQCPGQRESKSVSPSAKGGREPQCGPLGVIARMRWVNTRHSRSRRVVSAPNALARCCTLKFIEFAPELSQGAPLCVRMSAPLPFRPSASEVQAWLELCTWTAVPLKPKSQASSPCAKPGPPGCPFCP